MKPKKIHGCNVVFGENQPEYQPLPAQKMPDGEVITCWELNDDEVDQIVLDKKIYIRQLTFNRPLQPILPSVDLGDGIDLTLPESQVN